MPFNTYSVLADKYADVSNLYFCIGKTPRLIDEITNSTLDTFIKPAW